MYKYRTVCVKCRARTHSPKLEEGRVMPPPSPPLPPSSSSSPSPDTSIFCLSFNQDYGCISCGTSSGYRVFQSDPLQELFRREFDVIGWGSPFAPRRSAFSQNSNIPNREARKLHGSNNKRAIVPGERNLQGQEDANGYDNADSFQHGNGDGFTIVEMLYRTNMVVLVCTRYASNKVVIWDDYEGICTGELLFRSAVLAVRLRSDRIAVVLEHRICVYNIVDLRLMHQMDTFSNPRGLCALSSAPNSCVMACPGLKRGEVRVVLYESKKNIFIEAHTSSVACIALSSSGSILATASAKGTLIRLFNTVDGTKVQELRRGSDQADIYSIAFSCTNNWLAVSSDKGTIHIFCLREAPLMHNKSPRSNAGYIGFPLNLQSNTITNLTSSITNGLQLARSSLMSLSQSNTGSSLSFMKGVLPSYFSSEWSFAQFKIPEDAHAIVAFGKERNHIIVLCSNGSYYRCSFDPLHGNSMKLEAKAKIFDAPFVR